MGERQMSKTFILVCPKHGVLKIEVEKPSIIMSKNVYCPWCAQRLSNRSGEREKWIPNYNAGEVPV